MKFVSLLIDLDVYVDTTNSYDKTWAKEFVDFVDEAHEKGKRFLHLEIGDSFSMGLTEERELYSWGLNDLYQCAKDTNSFTSSVSQVKNLTNNNIKTFSLGKDHGLMVDEANHVYTWGKNSDGSLGLGHSRKVNSIVVLEGIKGEVKTALAKENKSYVLTTSGKVYEWPTKRNDEIIYSPIMINLNKVEINSISIGVDFIMMLAPNGILYSKGSNTHGELGLDDYEPRE